MPSATVKAPEAKRTAKAPTTAASLTQTRKSNSPPEKKGTPRKGALKRQEWNIGRSLEQTKKGEEPPSAKAPAARKQEGAKTPSGSLATNSGPQQRRKVTTTKARGRAFGADNNFTSAVAQASEGCDPDDNPSSWVEKEGNVMVRKYGAITS